MSLYPFRFVFLSAVFLLVSPLLEHQVKARWATFDDASLECLDEKVACKVKKDGSCVIESEIQLKILNESRRNFFLGPEFTTYDAAVSLREILEVRISNNGQEITISKEKIEDKPLASEFSGVSDKRQILIPFEGVVVNSIIYLKSREVISAPVLEKYFSFLLEYNSSFFTRKSIINIESEIPLFLKINDPRNHLEVIENKTESLHTVQVNLKKPIYEVLIDEAFSTRIEPENSTFISVSTEAAETGYDRVGRLMANFFQPLLTETLPEELEAIRRDVEHINDEVECINTIGFHLSKKIRYFGTWNKVGGHIKPRPLKDIITTGYGDCKEYSACLASILDKLGYKARVAVVCVSFFPLGKDELYGFEHMNHAIVKAISPSGTTCWLDPTRGVIIAGSIPESIADRPVLVLDPENPTYERTPAIGCRHAISRLEKIITFTQNEGLKIKGSICFEGEDSAGIFGLFRANTPSFTRNYLTNSICGYKTDPTSMELILPESLSSKKVESVRIPFSYIDDSLMTRTNLGDVFFLEGYWYDTPYMSVRKGNEGALCTGNLGTNIRIYTFENARVEGLDKLAFCIETPWINAKREVSLPKEDTIVITETIERLTTFVASKDQKSQVFENLQKTLRLFCKAAIVFLNKE